MTFAKFTKALHTSFLFWLGIVYDEALHSQSTTGGTAGFISYDKSNGLHIHNLQILYKGEKI